MRKQINFDNISELHPEGSLTLLTGRPQSGKADFCKQLERELISQGKGVCFLDYENDNLATGKHVTAAEFMEGFKTAIFDPNITDIIINSLSYLTSGLSTKDSLNLLKMIKRLHIYSPKVRVIVTHHSPVAEGRYSTPITRNYLNFFGTILHLQASSQADERRVRYVKIREGKKPHEEGHALAYNYDGNQFSFTGIKADKVFI